MRRLEGGCALITGGSRGIGAAVARRLAADGAAVTVTYRERADLAKALVRDLKEAGHAAHAIRCDVTDRAAIHAATDQAAELMGGLGILISNAGIEYFGPLADITEADFRRVFDTNVAGQLFSVQAAVPHMTSGGRIVLMASVSARVSVHQHSVYAASKAAVSALAANLAPELAEKNIAINVIAPGGTATDMAQQNAGHYLHPELRGVPGLQLMRLKSAAGRLARPDEIAAVIAFLASPDAIYVNGTTLAADGGWM